jgi:hypothetical protein
MGLHYKPPLLVGANADLHEVVSNLVAVELDGTAKNLLAKESRSLSPGVKKTPRSGQANPKGKKNTTIIH